MIPENKSISPESMPIVEATLKFRGNTNCLQNFLHSKGCFVTLKDLHNLIQN